MFWYLKTIKKSEIGWHCWSYTTTAHKLINGLSLHFFVYRGRYRIVHRAFIEGFSRRNAFWRLDSEFRVKIWWTPNLEYIFKILANLDFRSRVIRQFWLQIQRLDFRSRVIYFDSIFRVFCRRDYIQSCRLFDAKSSHYSNSLTPQMRFIAHGFFKGLKACHDGPNNYPKGHNPFNSCYNFNSCNQ